MEYLSLVIPVGYSNTSLHSFGKTPSFLHAALHSRSHAACCSGLLAAEKRLHTTEQAAKTRRGPRTLRGGFL